MAWLTILLLLLVGRADARRLDCDLSWKYTGHNLVIPTLAYTDPLSGSTVSIGGGSYGPEQLIVPADALQQNTEDWRRYCTAVRDWPGKTSDQGYVEAYRLYVEATRRAFCVARGVPGCAELAPLRLTIGDVLLNGGACDVGGGAIPGEEVAIEIDGEVACTLIGLKKDVPQTCGQSRATPGASTPWVVVVYDKDWEELKEIARFSINPYAQQNVYLWKPPTHKCSYTVNYTVQ